MKDAQTHTQYIMYAYIYIYIYIHIYICVYIQGNHLLLSAQLSAVARGRRLGRAVARGATRLAARRHHVVVARGRLLLALRRRAAVANLEDTQHGSRVQSLRSKRALYIYI